MRYTSIFGARWGLAALCVAGLWCESVLGDGPVTTAIIPDNTMAGPVVLSIQRGSLASLPAEALQGPSAEQYASQVKKVGDLIYGSIRGEGNLFVSSGRAALLAPDQVEAVVKTPPSGLWKTEEPTVLKGFRAGWYVVFQDLRGKAVLMAIQEVVGRGLRVSWVVSNDPALPFTQAQVDALQKEAQRIELERQKREERPKPQTPVAKEDRRTPDEKLFALAWLPGKMTDEQVRSQVQALLAAGANPNAISSGGSATPLTLAAGRGGFAAVQVLVENGADLTKSMALLSAAQHGQFEIARYLLDHGADITQRLPTGETVLQLALRSENRSEQLIKFLRERGAATLSLPAAAEAGDLDAIRRLVAAGNDINAQSPEGLPPLLLAAKAGQVDACKLLLELGADPARGTRKGGTSLDYLLVTRKLDAVPLLIEHSSAEVLRRALPYAAAMHRPDLMRQILARIPEPAKVLNEDVKDRLASALMYMSDPELQILEQAGLQLPLWAAARFGRLDRMKELLGAGADADLPAPWSGGTPLFLAVRNHHVEAARLLLAAKANPNINYKSDTQPTPLHEAAANGDVEMAHLLTAHKADPNVLDSLNRPPLYYAVTAGNRDLSRVLLEGGADPNIVVQSDERDKNYQRIKMPVWKLATDPELIKLLKAHGAK